MAEYVELTLIFLFGLVLGILFFAGLWWTVRQTLVTSKPWYWFTASFLLRVSIVLSGFYLIGNGSLWQLLSCLLGFMLARLSFVWLSADWLKPRVSHHAP